MFSQQLVLLVSGVYGSDTQCVFVHTDQRSDRRLLAEARKLTASREALHWMTPSDAPKSPQASERSELLDAMRASWWNSAWHFQVSLHSC
jgi:hypothetical protein